MNEEIADSTASPARYTAVVRFREDQAIVTVASKRARAQGTQLASVLRGLLRQWLARDAHVYKEAP